MPFSHDDRFIAEPTHLDPRFQPEMPTESGVVPPVQIMRIGNVSVINVSEATNIRVYRTEAINISAYRTEATNILVA